MFKWLKKVMISIINAIKSLFVGNKPVQSISIGDTQVYPNGVVSYAMAGSPTLEYSSGSMIPASGNGYARIVGTLVTYVDNVEQGRSTVEFTPSLITSGVGDVWSVSGTHIQAANRSSVTGSSRSATFSASYTLDSFHYNGGNFTVTQQGNSKSAYPGYISLFTVADAYVEGDDPNNTGTTTLTLDENSITCQYTVSGTGGWIYTSGYISQASRTPQWEVVGVKDNDLPLSWITATPDTSDYQSGDITFSSLSSGSRSGYIKVCDSACPEVYLRIPVTQAVNSNTLTFYSGGTVSLSSDSTSFSINVVPKNGGVLISNTSELSVQIVSSTIGNLSIGTKTLYSNYVRVSFSCSANTSTTSNKTATIRFSYGGKSITATVTQEKYHPIPSFFSQAVQADNDSSWWIGTPNINGTSKGIFMYCENSITEDTEVEINIDWIGTKGGTTYNCEEEGNLQIIPQRSEQNVGGYSKTGYWLISKDGTAYNLEIDSTFTITDFTVYSFTIRN